MTEILGSIWWLLVALGVLVTFHEFGHYWVARRCGVRVLRFSVGFGRPLWMRRGADGTEYVVAAIPLGGYVKMLDEREAEVPQGELKEAFNRKPVWQRIAIVAAGPAFNLVFAVLAFWVMFMVGIPESRPVIGETTGIAARAGIVSGDEIVALDGEETRTWSHAILGLMPRALDRDTVRVTVEDAAGNRAQRTLDFSALGERFDEENLLGEIGIEPWRATLPPVVGLVSEGSPAQAAGLRPGDRILRIAGEDVPDWGWISFLVEKHATAGAPLAVEVERGGTRFTLDIVPMAQKEGWFSSRPVIGIGPGELPDEVQAGLDRTFVLMRHGPVEGLGAAVSETWRLTTTTLGLIGRMVTGNASVKNLSGPVSIARFANSSANAGLSTFLFFLGAISLSLGILNLLPIPILDGGHLVYYLVEWVKGSPVSEQAQVAGQYIGLAALAGLMSLAFINDILRLVG